jgi:hypothetical protein
MEPPSVLARLSSPNLGRAGGPARIERKWSNSVAAMSTPTTTTTGCVGQSRGAIRPSPPSGSSGRVLDSPAAPRGCSPARQRRAAPGWTVTKRGRGPRRALRPPRGRGDLQGPSLLPRRNSGAMAIFGWASKVEAVIRSGCISSLAACPPSRAAWRTHPERAASLLGPILRTVPGVLSDCGWAGLYELAPLQQ